MANGSICLSDWKFVCLLLLFFGSIIEEVLACPFSCICICLFGVEGMDMGCCLNFQLGI